jgi:hypothetical protein
MAGSGRFSSVSRGCGPVVARRAGRGGRAPRALDGRGSPSD